jgi:ABC-type dipeptide/oligopeptide/nickel transport system permease component
MLGPDATDEDLVNLRQIMGLDRPLLVQLGRWYSRMLRGDLGYSIFLQRPVLRAIYERLEPTSLLTTLSLLLAIAIGVPAGIIAAVRRNTWVDQASMGVALVGVSVPNFWLGPVAILLFSIQLGWLPVSGFSTPASVVLPAATLGLALAALLTRMVRSALGEELAKPYLVTGRSKGLRPFRLATVHALRNALVPVVTVVGLQFGSLLTGAILTETIFGWPGLGRLLIQAIRLRDFPLVQGGVLLIAITYVVVNLVTDLVYAWLDPRIRVR